MAESPAHRFGQLIGELLESVVRPQLEDFCQDQGLYLDHQKRERPARSGKKVSWTDQYGNAHDLDFVIEREGTDHQIGRPVAFIESAWRRYTKHSRNKAQEILRGDFASCREIPMEQSVSRNSTRRCFYGRVSGSATFTWIPSPIFPIRVSCCGVSIRRNRYRI